MFDFAWSEIALIGAVALVLIGPKDMPIAIKAITGAIKKARRMAAEFQTHVDDMVRDADLHEVRDGIRQIRSMDIRGTISRAVDSDGSIRKALADDPIRPPPPVVTTPVETLPVEALAVEALAVEALAEHTIAAPEPALAAPDFIPPADVAVASPVVQAPAFIPPAFIPLPVAPPAFAPPAFGSTEAAVSGPVHEA